MRIRPEDGGVQINSEAGVAYYRDIFHRSKCLKLSYGSEKKQIIAPVHLPLSTETEKTAWLVLGLRSMNKIGLEQAHSFIWRHGASPALRE